MAYTRKYTARKTSARSGRRAAARPRARAGRSTRRASTRNRGSSAARTLKIVIETAPQNLVQRPDLGLVAAPRVRRPAHAS